MDVRKDRADRRDKMEVLEKKIKKDDVCVCVCACEGREGRGVSQSVSQSVPKEGNEGRKRAGKAARTAVHSSLTN